MSHLPIHPVTGLEAVGIVNGRAVWPILGADERGDAAVSTRLTELDTKIETTRTALLEFADAGDLDDEAATRFDSLEAELGELETEREPIARRAATIARVRESARTGRGVQGPGVEVMTRVQPFADLDKVASRALPLGDVRSRALKAVETVDDEILTDAQRSKVERLIRNDDDNEDSPAAGRMARHMLLSGSPEYRRAFGSLLRGRQPWQLDADQQRAWQFADEHMRAVNEGTANQGGYLVPFYLDPTVILTNAGSTNPMRQVCDVETIATNAWHGISTAGISAGYLGEAAEVTESDPTFAQPTVTVNKKAVYVEATFEAMQDTNIVANLGTLLADSKDQFEATENFLGDGASGHDTGLVTALAAVSASVITTATAVTFAVGDLYTIHDDLGDRWLAEASWMANKKIQSLIRQFATGTGQNTGAFWQTLGGGLPPELLGESIRHASALSGTVAAGNYIAAFGNFKRAFKIVDRIGMTLMYEPLVKGSNQRPTGKAGWLAYWRGGSGAVVPSAARLLKVHA